MIGFEPGYEARVVADEVRFNIPDYLLQAALDASYAAKDHTHTADQISGLEGALGSYLTKTEAATNYATKLEISGFITAADASSNYASKTHTHAVGDVNGLQNQLNSKLPTNGGRADAFGVNGDFSQYSDGQTALWFRTAGGAEKTVIWTNGVSTNLNVRVNGKTSYFTTDGDIVAARDLKAPGWVYAGNGSANFQGNGNVVGSIWSNWGSTDAYTAIHNRIEKRAQEFADDRIGQAWWRCRDYLLGELIPVGCFTFARPTGNETIGLGSDRSGVSLYYSNSSATSSGGQINYGTWRSVSAPISQSAAGLFKRIG